MLTALLIFLLFCVSLVLTAGIVSLLALNVLERGLPPADLVPQLPSWLQRLFPPAELQPYVPTPDRSVVVTPLAVPVVGPAVASEVPVVQPQTEPSAAVVVGPQDPDRPVTVVDLQDVRVVRPLPEQEVKPCDVPVANRPPRAAWDEKGWRQTTTNGEQVFEGFYQATDKRKKVRRFPGRITTQGTKVSAFIADPPAELRHHPKNPCFQRYAQDGTHTWFYLNWARPAQDAETALLYVERVLDESFNHYAI